jgi:hypothetical protein
VQVAVIRDHRVRTFTVTLDHSARLAPFDHFRWMGWLPLPWAPVDRWANR